MQRLDLRDHDLAVLINNSALQFRRLAQHGASLEVDAVGHAGHQIAALGEKLHVELLQGDWNRLDQRLHVRTVRELDR